METMTEHVNAEYADLLRDLEALSAARDPLMEEYLARLDEEFERDMGSNVVRDKA